MQLVYFNEGVPSNMNALSFTEYIALNVLGVLLAMMLFVLVILIGVAFYREVLERMGKHVHKPFILGQDKIFLGVLSGIGETFNTHSLVVRILFIVFGIWILDVPITALAYGLLYLIMKRNTDDFINYYQSIDGDGQMDDDTHCSVCGNPIEDCECELKGGEWVTTEEFEEQHEEDEQESLKDMNIEDLEQTGEDESNESGTVRQHPYYGTTRTRRNLTERIKKAENNGDDLDPTKYSEDE